MSKISEMSDEELLFYIDGMTRHQRKETNYRQTLSFSAGDIIVWIMLGKDHSSPECPQKNLLDYTSFSVQMFDLDEGDSFGSPLGQGAIQPDIDVRFQSQPWAQRFGNGQPRLSGTDLCHLIRFLEKLKRLTAFL